jgi:hypothetical protein
MPTDVSVERAQGQNCDLTRYLYLRFTSCAWYILAEYLEGQARLEKLGVESSIDVFPGNTDATI